MESTQSQNTPSQSTSMNLGAYLRAQDALSGCVGIQDPGREKINLAIIAEVGELVQEVKWPRSALDGYKQNDSEEWAWWATGFVMDRGGRRDRVLGELCDIYHFVLMLIVQHAPVVGFEKEAQCAVDLAWNHRYYLPEPYSWLYSRITDPTLSTTPRLVKLIHLTREFGYDYPEFRDGFERSIRKNLVRWGHMNRYEEIVGMLDG